jgi:hypothetical protein
MKMKKLSILLTSAVLLSSSNAFAMEEGFTFGSGDFKKDTDAVADINALSLGVAYTFADKKAPALVAKP